MGGFISLNRGVPEIIKGVTTKPGVAWVVDKFGGLHLWPSPKTQLQIEDLYVRFAQNHADPVEIWFDPADLSEYNKTTYAKERVYLAVNLTGETK